MAEELPTTVDARRLAEVSAVVEGELAAHRLSRIVSPFVPHTVSASLRFALDGSHKLRLTGTLRTIVTARCQRCLGTVDISLAPEFTYGLVENAALDDETDAAEYLELNAGELNIAALVEDEIVLACPMIPVHDAGQCQIPDQYTAAIETTSPAKPFSGLKELLADEDKRNEGQPR